MKAEILDSLPLWFNSSLSQGRMDPERQLQAKVQTFFRVVKNLKNIPLS
jgi:hypothetical protein